MYDTILSAVCYFFVISLYTTQCWRNVIAESFALNFVVSYTHVVAKPCDQLTDGGIQPLEWFV